MALNKVDKHYLCPIGKSIIVGLSLDLLAKGLGAAVGRHGCLPKLDWKGNSASLVSHCYW